MARTCWKTSSGRRSADRAAAVPRGGEQDHSNSSLELDELLKVIMELAVLELHADRATLYLVDHAKGELWSRVVQGPEMVEIRLPLGKGIAGLVAVTGKVVNLQNAYDDPHFNPEVDRESEYKTQALLTIPVRNKREEIIGVLQILNKKGGSFTREDEEFFRSLAVHAALAIENALLYKEALEKRKFEEELALAGEIQRRLLPDHYPELTGLEVADLSFPCRQVGGDYFDYLKVGDHGFGCAVGDVSGKGMPAALLMANLQAGLRALVDGATPITSVMARLNNLLSRSSATKKFATLFYGEIDFTTRVLRYVNAGHIFPFIVSGEGEVTYLTKGGTIVGMFEDAAFEMEERPLRDGDVLVMFTDGVTDARDPEGREFGEARLVKFVKDLRALSPKRLLLELHREIVSFLKERPLEDDFTLVLIKAGEVPQKP
ncbi:MAG: GAF domain-containing SpoIIE family protein phosphatase [Acidobacteriota bacterium]